MTGYNKVFLDTAPLIYFLDDDVNFGQKAKSVFEEIPLPPPVSLASQSHHEKPPEVTCTSRGNPGIPASTRERASHLGCFISKYLIDLPFHSLPPTPNWNLGSCERVCLGRRQELCHHLEVW